MRRRGSYSIQAHVVAARAKLGSYAHLYLLLFMLCIFALAAFFSAPHSSQLSNNQQTIVDKREQAAPAGQH
jgi:hypothetical protein